MCNFPNDGIYFGVSKISQQVKALGSVLNDLSSIPSIHMKVEGEN